MTDTTAQPRAAFHAMTEGTKADWDIIASVAAEFDQALPDRALDHLRALRTPPAGSPSTASPTACRPRARPSAPAATTSTSSVRCSTTSATCSARTTTPTSAPRW